MPYDYDWNKARETVRRNWRCREEGGARRGRAVKGRDRDDKWKVEF